jgi:hypothetical protein
MNGMIQINESERCLKFQPTMNYFSSKDVCPISRSSVKIFT